MTATATVTIDEWFRTIVSATSELAPPESASASLVYIYPKSPLLGRRYVLGPHATIGRTTDSLIVNPDASVSRTHARVERRDGNYYVIDTGSTNGTFVNNARTMDGPLRDGDYLRFGNCIYRFLAGGNPESDYHEEIYRLMVLDPLTGVHNRRYLDEFLDRELARAARYQRPLALVLFDADHFKGVNDKYGHLAGDLTLKELAYQVRALVRRDELLARYGGEEFAVVLPESSADQARAFGERLRRAVEAHTFGFEGREYHVTVSVGVAVADGPDPGPVEELIQRADNRLYQAKRNGRNRVEV